MVKPLENPVTIAEGLLEGKSFKAQASEKMVDADEGWIIFESKGARKRKDCHESQI